MSEEDSVRSLMDGENSKLTTSTHVSLTETAMLQKHFAAHGSCWNIKIESLANLCSQYEAVQEREIVLWFINVTPLAELRHHQEH
jgi:hypothetical protein